MIKLVLFIIWVGFSQAFADFNCSRVEGYHEKERQLQAKLTKEMSRLKQEIANQRNFQERKKEQIRRSLDITKHASQAQQRISENSQILLDFQPIITDLISQDLVLLEINQHIQETIQNDEDVQVGLLLKDLFATFASALGPKARTLFQTLVQTIEDAERNSREWRLEQANLIQKLRLPNKLALETLLETLVQVNVKNDEWVIRNQSHLRNLELEREELNREVERSNQAISSLESQIAELQKRYDASVKQHAVIDQKALKCPLDKTPAWMKSLMF